MPVILQTQRHTINMNRVDYVTYAETDAYATIWFHFAGNKLPVHVGLAHLPEIKAALGGLMGGDSTPNREYMAALQDMFNFTA